MTTRRGFFKWLGVGAAAPIAAKAAQAIDQVPAFEAAPKPQSAKISRLMPESTWGTCCTAVSTVYSGNLRSIAELDEWSDE